MKLRLQQRDANYAETRKGEQDLYCVPEQYTDESVQSIRLTLWIFTGVERQKSVMNFDAPVGRHAVDTDRTGTAAQRQRRQRRDFQFSTAFCIQRHFQRGGK